ncbi:MULTISPECIES: ribosome assembly RNA-binding protein YhbY [unclassified Vagococcus]|uniref:ribosome assembly RNA-binding protein YhbY n=1 Tax=unclassified Vagococcus TaxID=2648499 RepID=UPI001F506D06|nr:MULTISPECIES: ribosome assembly RNA-binding protein YhbY [unclassified Vagococcus]MCI0130603.1 ribosome assembly RNA-binding protein YhbY [Vagococcus sp. CY53-2]UNM90030.1 ribosome assembly RNA-binding protein YhbY [Vagococcus sp. CY52-2]
MELRGKQKRFLRSQAHHLDPIVQIGKHGLTDTVYDQVDDILERRELIKITLLQNTDEDIQDVAWRMEEELDCAVVQIIGRIIVLFRPSSKEKYQKLSPLVRKM